jgi:hypothetical protein
MARMPDCHWTSVVGSGGRTMVARSCTEAKA